jgi:hypothetical protein
VREITIFKETERKRAIKTDRERKKERERETKKYF